MTISPTAARVLVALSLLIGLAGVGCFLYGVFLLAAS